MPGYKTVTSVDALPAHLRGLICPHCKLLLREAIQTEDGIRLCESCYRQISQKRTSGESIELIAPACKIYTDRAVRNETAELLVYCDHGCSWTGKAKALQFHLKSECPNVPEQCPNEWCQERFPVFQLSDHAQKYCLYKRVTCDWCHTETTINLLNYHMHHCQEFASEHHQHLDVLQPNVEEYGPPAHTQESLPLTLCTDPVNPVMEQGMGPTTQAVSSCPLLHPQNPDTLRRRSLHQQETLENVPPSPSLQLELPFPIQEQAMGQPAQLVTGLHHHHLESTEALGQRKLHQQGVQENSRTCSPGVNRTDGETELETRVEELETRVEELFRQQAALKTRIAELEVQLQASSASTHNRSFLWRIPDVSRRKQNAIEEQTTSIHSPPFYTGHNGYKMCVKAYLNGDGSGYTTHLSLFIVLMKGEHDALLKWPFKQTVSLTLLDQTHRNHITRRFNTNPESSSFQRPSSDMNVASGFPRFALNSISTNKDYVCDNVMYIKCTVDTAHIYQTY